MQDFCNGMLQILQGSINVAASLRCTASPEFVRCTAERLKDRHSIGQLVSRAGAVFGFESDSEEEVADDDCTEGEQSMPGASSAGVSSKLEPVDIACANERQTDVVLDEPVADSHVRPADGMHTHSRSGVVAENLKAVFIPNLLIRLGMQQVRLHLYVFSLNVCVSLCTQQSGHDTCNLKFWAHK